MFYAVRLEDEKIMEFKTNALRMNYISVVPCFYKQKIKDKNHIKLLWMKEKMN